MYKETFQRIIDAAQNNSLTFFVGAGVSALSGAPSWSDLIKSICPEIGYPVKEEYTSDEFLKIPQMYYYDLDKNDSEYYSFIKKCFEKSTLTPNPIHKMMLSLNPTSFITTNFDELLEDAALQNVQSFKTIACDTEIPSINGDRYIMKLHGDLKHKNIVFKEEDYLNYSENFKLIETVLKSVFSMNTVVFIGYGLNDYNIKLILNWAKSLLKDNFNAPIFLHTGDTELSPIELLYQESKGVKVIECIKCNPTIDSSTDYLERYQALLNAIIDFPSNSLNENGVTEAFDFLYHRLLPLDRLQAIRTQDLYSKIGDYVYIGTDGSISLLSKKSKLFKRYIEILTLTEEERTALNIQELEKYNTISSVFNKARITAIIIDNEPVIINANYSFGDSICINFDYCAMHNITNQRSKNNNYEIFQKAYYLARLMRYDEAYFEFSKVANTAFKENDYLLYYLAQINCNNLHTGMKSLNRYYANYDMDKVEDNALNDYQLDHLFESLPIEFKNEYQSLSDLASPNVLYKYSYNAFLDGKKLQDSIESNTLEFGQTSGSKAMSRINDYLHFLLANGIYLDAFSEFKNTVNNLMTLLVYKYSEQTKTKLENPFAPDFSHQNIFFDEIDFFCFIEYFDSKSIKKLFNKYNVSTIEFENMDVICNAIDNLTEYYQKVLYRSNNHVEVINYQNKLKTCLALLQFMNLPQATVDKICEFIFKYEFREININDKILFLDKQLYRKGKYSSATAKIIEDKLIYYLDKHISSIKNGIKFELMSTSSLNYFNLVQYISPDKNYHSRRLSLRVGKILKIQNPTLLKHMVKYYAHYVSTYQRNNVIIWIKNNIKENFDFTMFSFLIAHNAKIEDQLIDHLRNYIRKSVETRQQNNYVQVFPKEDNFSELNDIGYWCFLKKLNKKTFAEFIGLSDMFDFYYLYTDFDFERFDVSWLLNTSKAAITAISKNSTVRKKIRLCISDALVNKQLSTSDESKLFKILAEYFC